MHFVIYHCNLVYVSKIEPEEMIAISVSVILSKNKM